ncbi:unnamed protein product [Fusarium fujikuroi]|nr:unnamed protein product [Fusarium fujikuroi]
MLYYRTTARAFHRPVRDQGKLSSLRVHVWVHRFQWYSHA